MAGPFKMKGSPMQRNFGIGSPMKQSKDLTDLETQEEEIDLSNKSDEEIAKIVKRNMSVPHFEHKRTYDTRTDSVAAAREEIYKRHKPKKKKE